MKGTSSLVAAVAILLLMMAAPRRAAAQVLFIPDDLTPAVSDQQAPPTPVFHVDVNALQTVKGDHPVAKGPGASLVAGYGAFTTSQLLDARLTLRNIAGGAHERNPVMAWTVSHPAALYAMKAGTIVGTIALVEKMRQHHPKAAFLFIAAVDSAYSAVVVHNYRVYRSLR